MGPLALLAISIGAFGQDGLSQYGLKPNMVVEAVDGKATIAEGETIELIAMTDLAVAGAPIYGIDLRPVAKLVEDEFWRVLDDRPPVAPGQSRVDNRGSEEYVRLMYSHDKDERTFAMVFRLSPNLHRALDVEADRGKTFWPQFARTRQPMPEDKVKSVGEARILKPLFAKGVVSNVFNYRLEVPGGAWTNLAEFTFVGDTKLMDGTVDAMMRYQDRADFVEVNGERKLVDMKAYYLTLTLPEALRGLELEVVTNDPAEDAPLLPKVVTQHIRGENQGPEFTGKDLFLVYGLRSRGAERKFTLRARPKRTVVFKGIPFRFPATHAVSHSVLGPKS